MSWDAELNPIWVRFARGRLRPKHALSWGIVTLVVTAFVCLMVYLTVVERRLGEPAQAAKAMFLPIVIIQGVILMLAGTGTVASGLAQEREGGLLDYQRMTPMSPTAKIAGFVLGLPAREYFLFALTLPFLAFSVVVGEVPAVTVAHFYLVFFSSVWLYHMTGLVAGMTSEKPKRAAMASQGMVVLLYIFLPQLSVVGLTFLEFLTVRPTLYSMVTHELADAGMFVEGMAADPGRYEDVRFFGATLHPTVFTLMVQGFLLAAMFVVVHRKWRDEHSHPLSKAQGVLFHAGVAVFLVGSVWPMVRDAAALEAIMARLAGPRGNLNPTRPLAPVHVLQMLLFVVVLVAGSVAGLLANVVTPTAHGTVSAMRRARKLGQPRVPALSDGASGRGAGLVLALATAAAVGVVGQLGASSGLFFTSPPPARAGLGVLVMVVAMVLFVQGVSERFGGRVLFMTLFLGWMLPLFGCLLLWAAKSAWVAGTWVGLPCPPIALGLASLLYLEQGRFIGGEFELVGPPVHDHVARMVAAGVVGYVALAVAVQWELARWRRGLALRELRARV